MNDRCLYYSLFLCLQCLFVLCKIVWKNVNPVRRYLGAKYSTGTQNYFHWFSREFSRNHSISSNFSIFHFRLFFYVFSPNYAFFVFFFDFSKISPIFSKFLSISFNFFILGEKSVEICGNSWKSEEFFWNFGNF